MRLFCFVIRRVSNSFGLLFYQVFNSVINDSKILPHWSNTLLFMGFFFPSWHTSWLLFSNFKPSINGLNWLSLTDTLGKMRKSYSNVLLFMPALITALSLPYPSILQKYVFSLFLWTRMGLKSFEYSFSKFTFEVWTSAKVVKWKLIEMVENENNLLLFS